MPPPLTLAVENELRREIFLAVADMSHETEVSASQLAHWFGSTHAAITSYANTFPTADRAALTATLQEAAPVATTLAEELRSPDTVRALIAKLAADPETDAYCSAFSTQYYQLFVQITAFARRYYVRSGYNPDAFVSGQDLFLAMSFDHTMRPRLTQALQAANIDTG